MMKTTTTTTTTNMNEQIALLDNDNENTNDSKGAKIHGFNAHVPTCEHEWGPRRGPRHRMIPT